MALIKLLNIDDSLNSFSYIGHKTKCINVFDTLKVVTQNKLRCW